MPCEVDAPPPVVSIDMLPSADGCVTSIAGMLSVFPGHADSYWCLRLSNSNVHVANAERSSLNKTKSERSSLNATQISSVGGGAGSNLYSSNACSNAFAFFWPTFAGSFIFCDRADMPVPRKSLNLMPALSMACEKNTRNF